MIRTLRVVLADGSFVDDSTIEPLEPTTQRIAIPRGEDAVIRLVVRTADGARKDITPSGWDIRLTVRRLLADESAMFTRVATLLPAATPPEVNAWDAYVTIPSADTLGLIEKKVYHYDVQLTDPAGIRWQGVPDSDFQILSIVGQVDEPILPAIEDPVTPIAIGPPGLDGASFLSGSGVPSSGLGANGDHYLNETTGDVYAKSAGAWATTGGNLTGPPGADGDDGDDGDDGTDGKSVLNGLGAPGSGLGVDGDFYLRTDTSQLYGPKTAGVWGAPVNLVGPPGADGDDGDDGDEGPQPPLSSSTPLGGVAGGLPGNGTEAAPWNHQHPILPLASLNSDGYLSATDWAKLQALVATWPISVAGVQQVRTYLLDNDGGDDTNVGYIDGAVGATLVPAGLAIKTLERLFQIIPKLGNSRWVVVLCKARAGAATYLKQDNATSDSILTAGLSGYSYIRLSGSTDLTNSASDQITQGFEQVAVGPNGDGSFTVGAGSTTTLINLHAGTISAEPAAVQYRIRFSPTTVTVALRNQCRVVTANTTLSVTPGSATSTGPATGVSGDQFFIERPGFSVDKVDWAQGTPQDSTSGFLFYNILTGVRCTSTVSAGFTVSAPASIVVGCEQSVNQATSVPQFRDMFSAGIRDAYTSEASAAITLGMGLRAGSPVGFSRITSLNVQCLGMMRVGGTSALTAVYSTNGGFGNRCYSAGIVDARFCGVTGGANLGETFGFVIGDTSATNAAFRVVAGQILFSQTSGGVRRLDFASCTSPCIKLTGMGCTLAVDGCTGTSGNTDAGIDMSAAVASTLIAGRSSANTVSGTSGDIKVAGTAIATHAGLTLTGFEDNACNKILGTGLPFAAGAQLVSNQSGGAVAVGDLVRGNGTTGQVTSSQATTNAATAAVTGVMVTAAASASNGYMAGPGGYRYVLFDGTPTAGAIAYVSPGTIRKATTTAPLLSGTNQKSRIGRVHSLSGSTGVVAFNPEALPTTADGNA